MIIAWGLCISAHAILHGWLPLHVLYYTINIDLTFMGMCSDFTSDAHWDALLKLERFAQPLSLP
jgi:hypothetical protein